MSTYVTAQWPPGLCVLFVGSSAQSSIQCVVRKAVELGEVAFCVGTEVRSCMFLAAIPDHEREQNLACIYVSPCPLCQYASGADETSDEV